MRIASLEPQDLEVIRQAPLFSGLTAEMTAELLRGASVHCFAQDAMLFAAGDPADRFFVVIEGAVRLLALTPDGHETIIDVVGAGSSFAEAAIFASRQYPVQAEALAGSRIACIEAASFLARIKENRKLALEMLAALGRWQLRLMGELQQLTLQTPAQRLAWYLVTLTDQATGGTRFKLPYRKSVIASRIGIAPESLSRALARLAEIGVESHGDEVIIRDVEALKRFCGV